MASNERKIFSKIQYKKNKVFLHFDESLMPKLKKVWSSWNYLENGKNEISVTYWMNQLQKLETSRNIFVTLNPSQEPKKDNQVTMKIKDNPQDKSEEGEKEKTKGPDIENMSPDELRDLDHQTTDNQLKLTQEEKKAQAAMKALAPAKKPAKKKAKK